MSASGMVALAQAERAANVGIGACHHRDRFGLECLVLEQAINGHRDASLRIDVATRRSHQAMCDPGRVQASTAKSSPCQVSLSHGYRRYDSCPSISFVSYVRQMRLCLWRCGISRAERNGGMLMFKFVISAALAAVLLLCRMLPSARRRTHGRTSPGNSTSMCCRCRGRRRSARPPRSARRQRSRRCNAARGRIRSSCTGCGRNTTRAFRNIARCRRRGSTAASSRRCSI